MTTFLDARPQPGHALRAHLRRHPFPYLSVLLHAALLAALAALAEMGSHRIELQRQRIERARQQQSIDEGRRLTERVRLEQRVHDMERIASLIEQSAAAGEASAHPLKTAPAPRKDDDADEVRFSARPRTPDALLAQAGALARKIDGLQRDIQARELARLLAIPKQKALDKLQQAPSPQDAPPVRPVNAAQASAQAAAQIEQLEAKARAVLAQRRRELERQQDGVRVAASAAGAAAGADADAGANPGADAGRGPAGQGRGGGQGSGDSGGVSRSLLNRIDAFTNPDLPGQRTQAYTSWGMHDFFDHGIGTMPAVDAGRLRKGAGRIVGPGGSYANRVYVDSWYLIGPFEGKHGEGLFANDAYPPEQGVVLDAAYRGKGGRVLRWEYVDHARYPLIPAVPAEDAVYYGYTELMMDQERDLTIWVGADDDAQLWLNDRLVWKGGNVNKEWFFGQVYDTANSGVRDYNLSEGTRRVHVRKGRNKLFFKLSNGPTRLFFSLVLTR